MNSRVFIVVSRRHKYYHNPVKYISRAVITQIVILKFQNGIFIRFNGTVAAE